MVRRDADDVDPTQILLLAPWPPAVVMTPLVLGGLKQSRAGNTGATTWRGDCSIERRVEPCPRRRSAVPLAPLARQAPAQPETRLVAAPVIDASCRSFSCPEPQVASVSD